MADDSQAAQSLEYLLAQASHRMKTALVKELASRGVTLEHWRIPNLLSNGRGWTMGELAETSMISFATATRNIDAMVSEALVYRAPDPDDGRKVVVFQSDKGRKLWSEISKRANLCESEVLEQYGSVWIENLVARLETLTAREPKPRRR